MRRWFFFLAIFAVLIAGAAHAIGPAGPIKTLGPQVPASGYTLDIDFRDQNLPADATFTRVTSGTYFNASGMLVQAASGNARFGYVYDGSSWVPKGVLLEGSRQNQILQSENFGTTWGVTAGVSSLDTTLAPDGATTADTLTDNSAGGFGRFSQNFAIANDSTSWTTSFFVKKTTAASSFPLLNTALTGGTQVDGGVVINTDNCTLTDRTGVVPDASGYIDYNTYCFVWLRNDNTSTGNTNLLVEIFPAINTDASGAVQAAPTGSIVAWGVQVENAAFPSSYIATTTAAVARAADTLTLTRAGGSTGALYASGRTATASGTQVITQFDDGTENNQIEIARNVSNQMRAVITDSGTDQADMLMATIADATDFKVVVTWQANDFAAVADGGTVQTDSSGTVPTTTTLRVGSDSSGNQTYGFISEIKIAPRRLPNILLQDRTSALDLIGPFVANDNKWMLDLAA